MLVRCNLNGQAINLNMSESKCFSAKCVIVIIGVVATVVFMMALVIHFTATGDDEFNFDQGSNTANVQKSSGIHLIEVNSTDNEGWSWIEIGFVVLALKLVLMVSHTVHYCVVTKKLVKRKVDMEMMKTNPPAVASVAGGELHIPPLV